MIDDRNLFVFFDSLSGEAYTTSIRVLCDVVGRLNLIRSRACRFQSAWNESARGFGFIRGDIFLYIVACLLGTSILSAWLISAVALAFFCHLDISNLSFRTCWNGVLKSSIGDTGVRCFGVWRTND